MENQQEIWQPEKWVILFETVSALNPFEYLYGVRIGTRIHDEDPFVTVLISDEIYGLIKNNLVDVVINDSIREPISVYQKGKKLQLRTKMD